MVKINDETINVGNGLHQIVVDTNEETPKVSIELGAGMSNEEYLEWNLINAIKTIRRSPQEKEITISVYRLHKDVLKNKGVSGEDLVESDRILKKYAGVEA